MKRKILYEKNCAVSQFIIEDSWSFVESKQGAFNGVRTSNISSSGCLKMGTLINTIFATP
jgi:hypothetical protein